MHICINVSNSARGLGMRSNQPMFFEFACDS